MTTEYGARLPASLTGPEATEQALALATVTIADRNIREWVISLEEEHTGTWRVSMIDLRGRDGD
jgi:hypothetical protein